MKYTTNYNLKKPDDNDNVLISDLNGNADAVDAALHALDEGLKGAQGSLAAAPEKQILADGDGVVVTDSAAGNSAKRVLWSTVVATLGKLFAPLTHKHAAGDVTSGTFDAARIPGLAASKITSGILSVARGGTGVSSLAELAKDLGVPNIALGYYVGTGVYGTSNPNSISATFPIKLIIQLATVSNDYLRNGETSLQSNWYPFVFADLLTTSYRNGVGFNKNYNDDFLQTKKSADGKTIYWFHQNSASDQYNTAGQRYYYLILGG